MDNSKRTGSEQSWTNGVQIREVGGPSGSAPEYSPVEVGAAEGRETPRRFRPFQAAWILTGVLLAIGLLGIGGVFENATMASYSYGMAIDPATGQPKPPSLPPLSVQLRNLGAAAPMMLQTGAGSAAALLIIRGLRRSREQQQQQHQRQQPRPAPEDVPGPQRG